MKFLTSFPVNVRGMAISNKAIIIYDQNDIYSYELTNFAQT